MGINLKPLTDPRGRQHRPDSAGTNSPSYLGSTSRAVDDSGLGLDASDVKKLLLQLGSSPYVAQRGVDRLTGSGKEEIWTGGQYGSWKPSGTAPALAKLGLFRGQYMQRLPSTLHRQYNRPDTGGGTTYIGSVREEQGWGKLATGMTTIASVKQESPEAHKRTMLDELIKLQLEHGTTKGSALYTSMYGQLPFEDNYRGGSGFTSDMSNYAGVFSENEDMIRMASGTLNPDMAGGTLEHEGMHRGSSIMRNMYAPNQSAFKREGRTTLPQHWGVFADIPMERHNLPEDLLAAGGTSHLEDRFLRQPWSRTIGGNTYTLPDIMNMYKSKDYFGQEDPGFLGGEHAIIAQMQQNFPNKFRQEWSKEYYIDPFVRSKQDAVFPIPSPDEYDKTGRDWRESISSAATAIEKYLAQAHRWTPGGGKSTVLDRHIQGKYDDWTLK